MATPLSRFPSKKRTLTAASVIPTMPSAPWSIHHAAKWADRRVSNAPSSDNNNSYTSTLLTMGCNTIEDTTSGLRVGRSPHETTPPHFPPLYFYYSTFSRKYERRCNAQHTRYIYCVIQMLIQKFFPFPLFAEGFKRHLFGILTSSCAQRIWVR